MSLELIATLPETLSEWPSDVSLALGVEDSETEPGTTHIYVDHEGSVYFEMSGEGDGDGLVYRYEPQQARRIQAALNERFPV